MEDQAQLEAELVNAKVTIIKLRDTVRYLEQMAKNAELYAERVKHEHRVIQQLLDVIHDMLEMQHE